MALSVWVVSMYEDHEDIHIEGIFSSYMLAQQFVEDYIEDYKERVRKPCVVEEEPGWVWIVGGTTICIDEHTLDDYNWRRQQNIKG